MADFSMAGGAYAGAGAAAGQAVAGAITAHFANESAQIAAAGANAVRATNNATNAAIASVGTSISALQRWTQGVRNSRVYENVGRSQEALAVNFNRSRDAKANANFADSLRQAEASGRQQAAAAASGVTGSVVDVLDMSLQLKNHLQDVARVKAENYAVGDYEQAEFQQRWAILDSLDNSLILDTPAKVDYATNTARQTSVLGAALGSIDKKGYQEIGTSASKFFNFGNTGPDLFGGTTGIGDK